MESAADCEVKSMKKHLKIAGYCFCHHLGGKREQY